MGGIFNRKTIITVASVVYPMGEDLDKIPDMVKAGIITAAIRGQRVPPSIKKTIFDGTGVKLSQAWSYARNNYYAGIPTGLPLKGPTTTDPILQLTAKEYLEAVYAPDVITLHAVKLSYETDYDTMAEELVADEYDYDFFTLETLSATGSVQAGALLEMSGPFFDHEDPLLEGKFGYHLVFTNPDTSVVTIDKWYDPGLFAGLDLVTDRVMMRYSRNGGRSALESYEEGGASARLNLILRQIEHPESTTFPCITLKKNNVYVNDNKFTGSAWETSDAWRTSKTYAKRLGINIEDILSVVKDNENEKDIDYCFIQPGILVKSDNACAVEYMFNYFNRLRLINPPNKATWEAYATECNYLTNGGDAVSEKKSANPPIQSIRIYDEDDQKQTLDMEIGWRWMTLETKTGVLPDGKRFTKEVDATRSEIEVRGPFSRTQRKYYYETTMMYLRKQINSTQYEELAICGLRHINYVYKGHTVDSGVWAAHYDDESDDGTGFILPLDYGVYITLSARERLQLAQEALHMVFNCYVARKQKWYETGIFKVLMFIVMIVIIYFSWGTATPYVTATYTALYGALVVTLGATLAAAIAALITALIIVAISMAISLLAKEAGEWAAEKWGPAWGAVVQIVAIIVLSYGAGAIGGYGGVFSVFSAFSAANTVLMVGQAILSSMSAYTQFTYIALQDEIKDWSSVALAENNPLEQVNRMLEEMFPELTDTQWAAALPKPEYLDEFLGRTLTSVDGLTNRLFVPIHDMVDLTLTPKL